MAGDVFGNGALQSRATKLVAAFNHLHIFIDPDPDPAKSYAERERLFRAAAVELAGLQRGPHQQGRRASSTARPRPSRSRPRRRKLLDIDGDVRQRRGGDPPACLAARVDLLYNGGHRHLREGLERRTTPRSATAPTTACGWTARTCGPGWWPRAATWASPSGPASSTGPAAGSLNTDAVDNSGGVDMSDHEVNIKILMDLLVKKGVVKGKRGAQPHPRGDDRGGGRARPGRQREPGPRPDPRRPAQRRAATRSSWP